VSILLAAFYLPGVASVFVSREIASLGMAGTAGAPLGSGGAGGAVVSNVVSFIVLLLVVRQFLRSRLPNFAH